MIFISLKANIGFLIGIFYHYFNVYCQCGLINKVLQSASFSYLCTPQKMRAIF